MAIMNRDPSIANDGAGAVNPTTAELEWSVLGMG